MALTLVMLGNAVFSGYALIRGFRTGNLDRVTIGDGVIVLWILAMIYLAITYFFTTVIVDRTKLLIKSPFAQRMVRLKDTVDIELIPFYGDTIFFGYNVIVHLEGQKGVGIMSSLYGNRHQLLKAIIERAHYESPGFVLSPTLKRVYGPPPYGLTQQA
jgi:hypothetical protein